MGATIGTEWRIKQTVLLHLTSMSNTSMLNMWMNNCSFGKPLFRENGERRETQRNTARQSLNVGTIWIYSSGFSISTQLNQVALTYWFIQERVEIHRPICVHSHNFDLIHTEHYISILFSFLIHWYGTTFQTVTNPKWLKSPKSTNIRKQSRGKTTSK